MIDTNPLKLRYVTVVMERLSDVRILQYTGKCQTVSKNKQTKYDDEKKRMIDNDDVSNTLPGNNNKTDVKQMVGRFCPKCQIVAVKSDKRKRTSNKSCQKCGILYQYQCLMCKCKYKFYNSIYNHVRNKCRPTDVYRCSSCDHTTTDKYRLQRHIDCVHSTANSGIKCQKCGKQLKHNLSYKSHLRICGVSPRFFCDSCDYKTVYKKNIKKHVKRHLFDESTASSRVRIDKENIKKHAKKQLLDKSTTSSPAIKRIISIKQTKDELSIDKNGIADTLSQDANKGIYSSSFNRYCANCKWDVEHTKFQANKICPNCESELLFQCIKCGLQLIDYNRMFYHVQAKCAAQVSICRKCGKKCPSIRKLWTHSETCRKPYIYCKYCPFKTKRGTYLNSHVKKQHLIDADEEYGQDVKDKINIEGNIRAIENTDNWETAGIDNVDLGIVKIEKDTSLGYRRHTSDAEFETFATTLPLTSGVIIKEELMLSSSECSDNEGDTESLSSKRMYDDIPNYHRYDSNTAPLLP